MPENTRAMRGIVEPPGPPTDHRFPRGNDTGVITMAAMASPVPGATRAARSGTMGGAMDRGPVTSGTYEVQTPVFEGPFDLLLHLILREQVDLYEVSLSSIVDGYLAHIEQMERLNLEVTTEFLLIAATLVELKSRRLLPTSDEMDLDEELALWEERDLLLHRLVECKTFKEAAIALQAMASEAGRSRPRVVGVEERFVGLMPDLLADVTPDDLRRAFLAAVAPKPVPRVDLDHVAPIRASVTDALVELVDELPRLGRTTFRELTAELVERLDIVVRFLAVLELFKRGFVDLEQVRTFGDIAIVWQGPPRDALDPGNLESVDLYDG
jgi:segregation and condensation protein A